MTSAFKILCKLQQTSKRQNHRISSDLQNVLYLNTKIDFIIYQEHLIRKRDFGSFSLDENIDE